jgi:hypothetical protein
LIDAETYRAALAADIRSSSIMVLIDLVIAQGMNGVTVSFLQNGWNV